MFEVYDYICSEWGLDLETLKKTMSHKDLSDAIEAITNRKNNYTGKEQKPEFNFTEEQDRLIEKAIKERLNGQNNN